MIPKFRAWHKKEKKMYDVINIFFGTPHELTLSFYNGQRPVWLDHCILLQSTGLKDKNGKEIFEGDIIKLYHMDKGERGLKWTIKWDKDRASFLINRHRAIKLDSKWTTKMLEVIGNIYENPELLKEEK